MTPSAPDPADTSAARGLAIAASAEQLALDERRRSEVEQIREAAARLAPAVDGDLRRLVELIEERAESWGSIEIDGRPAVKVPKEAIRKATAFVTRQLAGETAAVARSVSTLGWALLDRLDRQQASIDDLRRRVEALEAGTPTP